MPRLSRIFRTLRRAPDEAPSGAVPAPRRRRLRRLLLLGGGVLVLAFVGVVADGYVQALHIARGLEKTFPRLEAAKAALLSQRPDAAKRIEEAIRETEQATASL